MASLTNLEIGSIVVTLIENVPAAISGLTATLVNNNVYFANQITNSSIGVDSIPENYQAGITSMTIGDVLGLMSAQGIGTKSVKIGELSIAKGMNESSSQSWKDLGLQQIKRIGETISSYQVWSSNA